MLLSDKVRKSRRSHAVSLKRKLNNNTAAVDSADPNTPAASLEDIARSVIHAPTDQEGLQHFEKAISFHHQKNFELFLPLDIRSAQALVNALLVAMHQQYAPTQLAAARILTNLAATEVSNNNPTDDDGGNYYGNDASATLSWSLLIAQTPGLVIPVLREAISQQDSVELSSQCSWCIGNLAGDESCRPFCLPVVPILVQIMQRSLAMQQVTVCRNATWALSNIARGPSAKPFLGESLITPSLIAQLLLSPERLGGGEASTQETAITWTNVANEMLWVVAFLTSREEDAVDYICDTTADRVSFSSQPPRLVCEALACRLATLVDVIPCIRAVGNIATACGGKHLLGLLEAHSGSIVVSLAKLVTMDDAPVVAAEAAWAIGTLLCDAGRPDHLSTQIAVPVLLPNLCMTVTSEVVKLDVKRESLAALWNACAAYPGESMGDAWSSRSARDDFLLQIYRTPKMLRTMVDILETSVDMDLTVVAVQLTNAMLRRLNDATGILIEFTEYQGVDALEGICDRASQVAQFGVSWQGGTEAADIAADLIDDLFSDNDEEMDHVAPTVSGDQFVFGTLQPAPAFNFETTTGAGRGVSSKPAWLLQKEQQMM